MPMLRLPNGVTEITKRIRLPKGLKASDPAMLIHPFHLTAGDAKPGIHSERGPKGGYVVGDCSGDVDTDQLVYAAAVAVDSKGRIWVRGGSGNICPWHLVNPKDPYA